MFACKGGPNRTLIALVQVKYYKTEEFLRTLDQKQVNTRSFIRARSKTPSPSRVQLDLEENRAAIKRAFTEGSDPTLCSADAHT